VLILGTMKILPIEIINRHDNEDLIVVERLERPYGWKSVVESPEGPVWKSQGFPTETEAKMFSLKVVDELNGE